MKIYHYIQLDRGRAVDCWLDYLQLGKIEMSWGKLFNTRRYRRLSTHRDRLRKHAHWHIGRLLAKQGLQWERWRIEEELSPVLGHERLRGKIRVLCQDESPKQAGQMKQPERLKEPLTEDDLVPCKLCATPAKLFGGGLSQEGYTLSCKNGHSLSAGLREADREKILSDWNVLHG